MLTLHSECHFWTIREEVRIKSTDYGAFRYARNRELQQQQQHQLHQQQQHNVSNHHYNNNPDNSSQISQELYSMAKRDYTERRNGIAVLKNSKKSQGRLKDNIKRLEELLRSQKIVYSHWTDASQVLLLFSNGIITHISVDVFTGDILRMVFEKYLVGKLAAEVISDAFFTRSHIVLAYNTNQLTVVYLQKPNMRPQGPEKISNMDPRIFHVIIPGASERKLSRHLSVNSSLDLFVIWTKSSQNEVYPWRPTIRDQDRANIHIFKIKGLQLESFAYCWSENDPLSVDFLRSSENQLISVEQKVSRKGEMSAEICSYEITAGKMLRNAMATIAMGTQICCHSFSPDQEKIFIGAIDRNICMHDLVQQTTKFVAQIDIVPSQCTWHCDSSIIMIANDRSQFQCFDLALTSIANQLQSEDLTPLNLLDISHYFIQQPTLLNISFSSKPDLSNVNNSYAQTDCFLLLLYEHGPIGCLRFFAGAGMRGDIHNSGITADVLVDKYLSLNQLEKAVNLLIALNWETYGAMCLISLHKIANYVFYRSEPRKIRIELMSKALKTFTESLSEETKDDFGDQVFDLKRRFFFFLLRKNLFGEAFEIAQDIEDYDLFMDLYNILRDNPNYTEYSTAALSQAASILHEEDRDNGNFSLALDYRSESACSQSTTSELNNSKIGNTMKTYVPALPSFKSRVFNAEMIKINIPKPELRVQEPTTATPSPEKVRPLPPPPPEVKHIKTTPSPIIQTTATVTTPPITSNNVGTLAALSLKSSTPQKSLKWQPILDQTVGIPASNDSYTTTAMLNTTLPRMPQQQNSTFLQHYATPIKLKDHSMSLSQPQQHVRAYHNAYQPKFYQHPLVSGTIPSTKMNTMTLNPLNSHHTEERIKRTLAKKPPASILSNSSATQNGSNSTLGHLQNANGNTIVNNGTNGVSLNGIHKENTNGKSTPGEKNKVKFSDTVQVAVVPEIPRKEKPMPPKRNGYSRPHPRFPGTNPRKELADSLPLCHPNDDYLKDFNPISTEENLRPSTKPSGKETESINKATSATSTNTPAIKVVHFGVV